MRSRWTLFLITTLVVAACQQAPDEAQLPTLAVLPSLTPTGEVAASPTAETVTSQAPTMEASATAPPPTVTTQPTHEPSPQPQTTSVAVVPTLPPASAPDEVRLATLTPVPAGANSPVRTTPMVMADMIITESEFQHELDTLLKPISEIQQADIKFVPQGIAVTLTALGGQAFVTGNVLIDIQVAGTFATFSIGDIAVNGQEPSEAYQEVVDTKFFPAIIDTLDTLLTQRLGKGHDLENIIMADKEMRIFLLIPER